MLHDDVFAARRDRSSTIAFARYVYNKLGPGARASVVVSSGVSALRSGSLLVFARASSRTESRYCKLFFFFSALHSSSHCTQSTPRTLTVGHLVFSAAAAAVCGCGG